MTSQTVATTIFQFGVGGMYANPQNVPGSALATPSGPQRFGTLQDVDVEISGKNVDLMGQNQFPDDVAASDKKLTFKAAFAALNIDTYNALFLADTIVAGSKQVTPSEQHTLDGTPVGAITAAVVHSGAAGTGYVVGDTFGCTVGGTGFIGTVATLSGSAIATFTLTAAGQGYSTGTAVATVTLTGVGSGAEIDISSVSAGVAPTQAVTFGAEFVTDLGVQYATGGYLHPVASSPAQGQYVPGTTLNGGLYTFNPADSAAVVLISYANLLTTGRTLQITSHIQGYGPVFEIWLLEPYQGANGMHLLQCRCTKMGQPLKRAGYVISDFEGDCYASQVQLGTNGLPLVAEWFQVSKSGYLS